MAWLEIGIWGVGRLLVSGLCWKDMWMLESAYFRLVELSFRYVVPEREMVAGLQWC